MVPSLDIEKLTVGELREISKIACTTKRKKKEVDHGLCIAVLQRGWVYIGEVTQSGDDYLILNGACIRRWGTTKGLGEIASNGPTDNTALEPVPEVKFHEAGKIFLMGANESKWAGKIK